jgi:hypothetical protein
LFDPTDGTNNMTVVHITAAVSLVEKVSLCDRLCKKKLFKVGELRLTAYHIAPILRHEWLTGDVCIINAFQLIIMFSYIRVLFNFSNLVTLQVINAYILHLSFSGMFPDRILTTSWRTQWLIEFKAKGKVCYSPYNDQKAVELSGAVQRCIDEYFKTNKVTLSHLIIRVILVCSANFDK